MKIDRLIGILSVLLQQAKVTAPVLAKKFEVSRRTIQRDIEALCQAGIPVVTEQGKNGGISIMDGFTIERQLFTSAEFRAILSGLRSLDSITQSNKYQLLMEKLSFAATDARNSKEHILINLSSWYKVSLGPKIELIQSAIENHQRIEFQYYSPSGESIRKIEPYLLVFQWSSWYVWGYCTLRLTFRLFKLNRMDQLCNLEESFEEREIPEFSVQPEDIYQPCGVKLTAVFTPEAKWRLIEEFGIHSFQELQDGKLYMEITWSKLDSLFCWLLGFRDQVEIIEPKEAREAFQQLLRKIELIYQ